MQMYLEILIILPLLVLCYQLYSYSVSGEGRERQSRCQGLGIAFMSCGIVSLVIKSAPVAFFGLVLMMFGFRLLAKGLDRLDKKIFIDRCEDDTLPNPLPASRPRPGGEAVMLENCPEDVVHGRLHHNGEVECETGLA
jgi:hypothetical protein